jgi:hypothetical protein
VFTAQELLLPSLLRFELDAPYMAGSRPPCIGCERPEHSKAELSVQRCVNDT